MGGDKGEGEPIWTKYFLSTPTRTLPHQKGEGIIHEISNIFGWNFGIISEFEIRISKSGLDDLPLPLFHVLRHISSIDDQGCMPHHPGVIDLTVVCNDHDGIHLLKQWLGERRGI